MSKKNPWLKKNKSKNKTTQTLPNNILKKKVYLKT